VIAAGRLHGTTGRSAGALLSTGPLRTVGRLSFAWYLWHWPVLILVEAKIGALSWPARCLLMMAALLLAVLTLGLRGEPDHAVAGRQDPRSDRHLRRPHRQRARRRRDHGGGFRGPEPTGSRDQTCRIHRHICLLGF